MFVIENALESSFFPEFMGISIYILSRTSVYLGYFAVVLVIKARIYVCSIPRGDFRTS